jgi:hypothetical protein
MDKGGEDRKKSPHTTPHDRFPNLKAALPGDEQSGLLPGEDRTQSTQQVFTRDFQEEK